MWLTVEVYSGVIGYRDMLLYHIHFQFKRIQIVHFQTRCWCSAYLRKVAFVNTEIYFTMSKSQPRYGTYSLATFEVVWFALLLLQWLRAGHVWGLAVPTVYTAE